MERHTTRTQPAQVWRLSQNVLEDLYHKAEDDGDYELAEACDKELDARELELELWGEHPDDPCLPDPWWAFE